MELTLNSAVMGVELSGIRRFTFLVRATPGACALTIGEPDLNTPDVVKEAAKAALDANDTHYPPGNGYDYMLQAVSKYEAEHHDLHYSPDGIASNFGKPKNTAMTASGRSKTPGIPSERISLSSSTSFLSTKYP